MSNTYTTDRLATVIVGNTINVNTDPVDPANVVNVWDEQLLPTGTVTTIISYTVPAGKKLFVKEVVGWGEYEAEFIVDVDGVQKGGGWAAPAARNMILPYTPGPIIANTGQLVRVRAIQNSGASRTMRANLMGELE